MAMLLASWPALSAVKSPLMITSPPVMPVSAYWLPTCGALMVWPSMVMLMWFFPSVDWAAFLVASANFSAPSSVSWSTTML